MLSCFISADRGARPLWAVPQGQYPVWLEQCDQPTKAWLDSCGFEAKPGKSTLLPGTDGALAGALAVLSEPTQPWDLASAYGRLPEGDWRLEPFPADQDPGPLVLGWALASYRFDRYRQRDRKERRLAVDAEAAARSSILAEAIYLTRNLINTPAADLGPAELAEAAGDVARRHGASFSTIEGEDLLEEGYPRDLRRRTGEHARATHGRPRLG